MRGAAAQRRAGSATVAALDAVGHAPGKKVLEEAVEVMVAAEHESGSVRGDVPASYRLRC